MPTDSELLSQLMSKLDRLLEDLPKSYQDRAGYDRQHEDLEHRVDALEVHVDKIDNTISSLHSSSMDFVNKELREIERRILDRIEARSHFSTSQWVLIAIAAVGWIISLLEFLK